MLPSVAGCNHIWNCPLNTQMGADEELFSSICVNPRILRAKAFSLVLSVLQKKILAFLSATTSRIF
jgi:hypothetical protein